MDPKEVARELRHIQTKYKDRVTFTGDVCLYDMARDSANAIEQLIVRVDNLEKECASHTSASKIEEPWTYHGLVDTDDTEKESYLPIIQKGPDGKWGLINNAEKNGVGPITPNNITTR